MCAGIEELASLKRISAASALVTLPNWPRYGSRVADLRKRIPLGLHVNLTLGAPLGPMPNLASDSFPSIEGFLTRCLSELPEEEIAAEISRQIARFEDHAGCKPDFVDGHQHVHVLPGVRSAFVRVLAAHFPDGVLVRDPSDTLLSILSRGGPIWKALSVAGLATGFGTSVRCIGLTTNYGFAGFSSFGRTKPFAKELKSFFRNPGRRHLVMCHPGYPDAELERLDRVVSRRRDELCCLLQATTLPNAIWHLQARDNLDRPIWPGDDPLPRRVVYDSAP